MGMEEKLHHFTEGLNNDSRVMAETYHPQDLDDAIQVVELWGGSNNMKGRC